jgi:hypothetical protein
MTMAMRMGMTIEVRPKWTGGDATAGQWTTSHRGLWAAGNFVQTRAREARAAGLSTADHRPPTTDHRPPTTDRRLPIRIGDWGWGERGG